MCHTLFGATPIINIEPSTDILDRNLGKLSAAFGMNRYTQEFDDIEDLSNVTYIYGTIDPFVGRLTTAELEFLESKNANVIEGNGGHDDTYFNFLAQGFKEAFGIE